MYCNQYLTFVQFFYQFYSQKFHTMSVIFCLFGMLYFCFSLICCLFCVYYHCKAQSVNSNFVFNVFRNTRWLTAQGILYPALCAVRREYPAERFLITWILLLALALKPMLCVNFVLLAATFRLVLRISFSNFRSSSHLC